MAVYLITYNLKSADDERHRRVAEAISRLVSDPSEIWHHKLQFDSVWWVNTEKHVKEVNAEIGGAFIVDDTWYVVEVTGREAVGRSAGDLWGWLGERGGK